MKVYFFSPDCLPSRPSSPLRFPFFHPFLLTSLKFWATVRRAYWHRLVVDDFFTVITHMHARTCWSGSRVDEQCQPRSSFGERSCSRKCIRPPGRSLWPACLVLPWEGPRRPAVVQFSTWTITSHRQFWAHAMTGLDSAHWLFCCQATDNPLIVNKCKMFVVMFASAVCDNTEDHPTGNSKRN